MTAMASWGADTAVASSLIGDVCRETAKNVAMKVPALRRRRLKRPRTSDQDTTPDEWIERYAFQPLRALLAAGEPVAGKRIAEIGPGDQLTSGLALLVAGASSYTAIDRFPGDYSGPRAKDRYRAVRDAWADRFPEFPWSDELDVERFPEEFPDRVRTIAAPIEEIAVDERFDMVCSFQVGEHVSNIRSFAVKTRALTAPGGVAVHRVDFGPHGPWRKYADPFAFLYPPDWLWRIMGSERGVPNRHRAHEFAEAFASAGLQTRELERELFDNGIVERSRRRLARRFQDMPAYSLRVRALTYVCRVS
jgi:hypothetical protein